MTFLEQHSAELHSTNPLERLNNEVKRPRQGGGRLPNKDSITRPIGAARLEQNDAHHLEPIPRR